jgi:ribosomal protein L39E
MGMGDEDKAATSKKQKTIRHDAQNQPHPSWRTVKLNEACPEGPTQ